MTGTEFYVGIDVSKDRLDVWCCGEGFSVANDGQGHGELLARLGLLTRPVIGVEPSGGYERRLCRALREAGLWVRLVDSWRLRQFAKACGRHAKTDPLDAQMIARFIEHVPAEAPSEHDPVQEEFRDLVGYRQELVDDKVRLGNRLLQLVDPGLRQMTQDRLEAVRRDLKQLERRIRDLIRANKALKRKLAILQSAPGIGFVNAITLLAMLPELGQRSPKKIAALVGLAPYDDKSGKRDGGAHIGRGRPIPRAMLYLAALTQLRCKPWARNFRDKLTAKGKPKMIAVVALMRRLIVALNAMIKQDRTWWEPAT